MAECKDPSMWEIIFGLLGALLLGLLGVLFLVIGIIAIVLEASAWLIASMFLLSVLCLIFTLLLGLWLKHLLDKLNRHLKMLDRLGSMVEKAEDVLGKLFPEKEDKEKTA